MIPSNHLVTRMPQGGDGRGSETLQDLLKNNYNIVTVNTLGDENARGVFAPFMVKPSDPVGFNELLLDKGGTARRVLDSDAWMPHIRCRLTGG